MVDMCAEGTTRWSDYEAPGLYLTFADGTRVALTREAVEGVTRDYWADSARIPSNDAFVNAYVLTALVTDVLHEDKDRSLREVLGGNDE